MNGDRLKMDDLKQFQRHVFLFVPNQYPRIQQIHFIIIICYNNKLLSLKVETKKIVQQ